MTWERVKAWGTVKSLEDAAAATARPRAAEVGEPRAKFTAPFWGARGKGGEGKQSFSSQFAVRRCPPPPFDHRGGRAAAGRQERVSPAAGQLDGRTVGLQALFGPKRPFRELKRRPGGLTLRGEPEAEVA